MKNISEDGMAIKLVDPVQFKEVVSVEFNIPQITPTTFQAKAEVVWGDSFEMGLRFLYIERESGIAFKSWLKLLQAQYQFHELAESS